MLCSLFSLIGAYGQETEKGVAPSSYERCSAVEYNQSLRERGLVTETKEDFENWLAPKIAEYKSRNSGRMMDGTIITIPVVVHVIHNGDPVNTIGNATSENISYDQVISQIDVLNQDYRRILGTPGAGTSGYGLGVDVEIEFCLAQRDPDGNDTDGVNRIDLGQESWTMDEVDSDVKPVTIWDPTNYMNMWSVKFGGADAGILGYAQFPSTSGLGGLNSNGGSANTDGVVSNFNAFGTTAQDDGSFILNGTYNLGRTMTHEVGHWLGLIHIWGDTSNCTDGATSGDYVVDTPASNQANYVCTPVTNCGSNFDMIENYMDYTNDACMDTFTQGQKDRILTVMANSPRRNTLGASNACQPVTVYGFDGSIEMMGYSGCNNSAQIELINTGSTTMTSATIEYDLDGGTTETYVWTGSLAQDEIEMISLPSLTGASVGQHLLTMNLTLINGMPDEDTWDNEDVWQIVVQELNQVTTTTISLTLVPDNYGSETTWEFKKGDGTLIASGGPYTDGDSTPETEVFNVEEENCYTFTIFDAYGDGMCCTYGNGSYELTTDDNTVVVSGGAYAATSESTNIYVNSTMTVEDHNFVASNFSIYPNPAQNGINISVKGSELPENMQIYNMLGQVILDKQIDAQVDLGVDISTLSSGIYFVKLQNAKNSVVLRFVKK